MSEKATGPHWNLINEQLGLSQVDVVLNCGSGVICHKSGA